MASFERPASEPLTPWYFASRTQVWPFHPPRVSAGSDLSSHPQRALTPCSVKGWASGFRSLEACSPSTEAPSNSSSLRPLFRQHLRLSCQFDHEDETSPASRSGN